MAERASMEACSRPPTAVLPRLEQWLWVFLTTEYYDCCAIHELVVNNKNNRRNFFCIDCNGSICEYCRSTSRRHDGHRILQIRRASNACSVDAESIACLIDTSGMHKFKINGYSIHFLVPRTSAEGSKKKAASADHDSRCDLCRWTLPGGVAQGSRFCSIYCKLAYKSSYGDSDPVLLAPVVQQQHRALVAKADHRVAEKKKYHIINRKRGRPTEGGAGRGGAGRGRKRARKQLQISDMPTGPEAAGADQPAAADPCNNNKTLFNIGHEEEGIKQQQQQQEEELVQSKIVGIAGVLAGCYPAVAGLDDVGSHVCSIGARRRKGVPHRSPLF